LKGMVFLSIFNREKIGDFIDRNLITTLPMRETIEKLHEDSLDKIIDLFHNWKKSEVTKVDPIGDICRGKRGGGQFRAVVLPLSRRSRSRSHPSESLFDIWKIY
jgi:hypothetical protein